jgi:hypothetical protein
MPDWLKFGFQFTIVFVACWGGAIAYWRTAGGNPATGDLLLYLFGLPSGLLLMFFAGRKLVARHAAAPTAATSSVPAKEAVTPAQTPPLAILAASLRLPHGASPEELATAIAANKARADLDKELVDDDGFPIMAARSGDAVDEVLHEEITAWLALNGMPEMHFSDEQWRALTLASAVVAELAVQTAGPMLNQVGPQTKLQLVPILPTEWDIAHRLATAKWLKHTVARYGWPADRVIVTGEETGAPDDTSPAEGFNRLARNAAASNTPLIAMVVACASHIGDESVSQWTADGSLFTSSRSHGRIPGEGAAGLLLTDLSLARSLEGSNFTLLDAMEEIRRDRYADESRRTSPTMLGELVERAAKRNGVALSGVSMIVADTDHRSSRTLELMKYVSVTMPQLDSPDDVVRVGTASGYCGLVPFITSIALAHHYASERRVVVAGISNQHPYRLCAALIRSVPSLT